jgi:hypothetical protein
MARLAVLVAMFVTACTPDAPAPSSASASAPAPEPATAKQCGPAQLDDLRRSLVGTCATPSLIDVAPLAIAMWAPVAELEPVGVHVLVTPDGVGVGGEPKAWDEPDFRTRVREDLATARDMWDDEAGSFTPRFVLAIHRDTHLADVAPVLRALVAENVDRGFLAFGSGSRPRTSPPRHPEIYKSYLAEIESVGAASERATYLARKVEPLAEKCPALARGFENAATTEGPQRCEKLMRDAADAIIGCGCPDYEPELVSWLQILVGPADAAHLHIDAIELAPATAVPAGAQAPKPNTTWGAYVAERKEPFGTLALAE